MTRRAPPRVVAIILVGILIVGRRPASLFAPQLWAEDGAVYLHQAFTMGALHAIAVPYAGYLQLFPRLITAVAVRAPVAWIPAICASASIAVAVWACTLATAERFRGVVRSDALRVALCCGFACVIPTSEVFGNMTNAHWYLSLGAFLVLLCPRGGGARSGTALRDGVVVVVAALSGAELVVLVPLALWRLGRSERGPAPVAMLFLLGIGVQLVILARQGDAASHAALPVACVATAGGYLYRVVLAAFAGAHAVDPFGPGRPRVLAAGVMMAAAGAGLLALGIAAREARVALGLLVGVGLLWTFAAMDGRGLAPEFAGVHVLLASAQLGGRYFVLPAAALLLGIAVVIDRATSLRGERKALTFCVAFIVAGVQNYELSALPDQHWARYAPDITAWTRAHAAGGPAPAVRVPLNPPHWTLTLPELRAVP